MKAKKIIALAFAMIFVVAAAMTVFAGTWYDGKYTNSITKTSYASYYTMNMKMRVTNGNNSGESMTVKIRPQYSNGNLSDKWSGEETGNNAVEIVTSGSGAYASGYLGWQGSFYAPSIGTCHHFQAV